MASSWVDANIGGHLTINWQSTSTSACWIIWIDRNQEMFEDLRWDTNSQLHYILDLKFNILKAFNSSDTDTCCLTPHISWHAQEVGWWEINTDGNAFGNPGRAGAGGVIRNYKGL